MLCSGDRVQYICVGLITDLNNSVLQASCNEKLISLHVEDEVGSDRLWEILECRIRIYEYIKTQ